MKQHLLPSIYAVLLLSHGSSLLAENLIPGAPFTDHMVLQRDMPVPVWGKAKPGKDVHVQFGKQHKVATADEAGKWMLTLDPLPGNSTGAPFHIRSGEERITLYDVVAGEVWICSGQSNMGMGRKSVPELNELSEANIRSFNVERTVAFEEQDTLQGSWKLVGPDSAVAFGFAHFLKQETEFPVGILLSCWGSSSIEAWMPRDMTNQLSHFKTIMDEWDINTEAHDQIKAALAKDQWTRNEDIFMRRQSCIVYNAMMKPLAPFACRGLVWYQGERNTRYISGMPKEPWFHRVAGIREYDETLKAWMQRYRKEWKREDFHFLVVMLPGYGPVLNTGPTQEADHPTAHSWAWMRESQLAALELPHTGVANTIDLGDVRNIHPRDKRPIGERLALLAARDTLERDIPAQGPVYTHVENRGNRLVVHFQYAKGLKTTDGKAPRTFWIAEDQAPTWHPARAEIQGETIVLHTPGVAKPTHVRYAFSGKPDVNLVNGAGLPTYPFRTDKREP